MPIEVGQASVVLLLDRTQFDKDLADAKVAASGVGGGGAAAGPSATAASSGGGGFGGFAQSAAQSSLGEKVLGKIPGGGLIGSALAIGNITGGTPEFFQGEPPSSFPPFMRSIMGMGDAKKAASETGGAMGEGLASGIRGKAEQVAKAAREAVANAMKAARGEAEISSPSRKGLRLGANIGSSIAMGAFTSQQDIIEAMSGGGLGVPIMSQVQAAMQFSTANVLSNMFNVAQFQLRNLLMNVAGGFGFGNRPGENFVQGDGSNVFASGLGSIFANQRASSGARSSGLFFPGFLGGLDSFGVGSREVIGQLPGGIRDLGQGILESVLGSILPGFIAGPAGDLLGTLLGTKPILSREAALSEGVFAPTGTGFGNDSAFSDSPFFGQGFVVSNNIDASGPLSVNQQVALDIVSIMRRLGIS